MGINPLGPLKLLNFKDRVPKAVQKWRLGICLKCEKAELGICTSCCYCPLAAKILDCQQSTALSTNGAPTMGEMVRSRYDH